MKEEEAEIKLSKMANLLLDMRVQHGQLVEALASKHNTVLVEATSRVAALSQKLDEVTALLNSQTYIKGMVKRINKMDNALHEAFMEGFGAGADHDNLPYKYPPANIAWIESTTRESIAHLPKPTGPRKEWYKNGEVTDTEEEKFEA